MAAIATTHRTAFLVTALMISSLVPWTQQHGIHKEKHGRFGERTIIRLLGESNHMSLAEGLVHEERLLDEDVLRIRPNQARGNEFVLRGIDADVTAAVQLDRRKHAIAFDHHLGFGILAGAEPVIGVDVHAQNRARLRRGPLAIGLDRLVVIERLARFGTRGTAGTTGTAATVRRDIGPTILE